MIFTRTNGIFNIVFKNDIILEWPDENFDLEIKKQL